MCHLCGGAVVIVLGDSSVALRVVIDMPQDFYFLARLNQIAIQRLDVAAQRPDLVEFVYHKSQGMR